MYIIQGINKDIAAQGKSISEAKSRFKLALIANFLHSSWDKIPETPKNVLRKSGEFSTYFILNNGKVITKPPYVFESSKK